MMRKILIVAGTATFLFGCSTSSSDDVSTPKELSDALPTVTDMPDGWSETQRQVFEQREAENPSIDPSIWCTEAKEASKDLIELAGESGADVEMQFENSSGMPRMMRLQAWANDDAVEYFDAVKASVDVCDGTTATDEYGAVTDTDVIKGRSLGDESVSWMQKTTPPTETQAEKLESIARTTVARFGSTIMVMQLGDAAMTGESELMSEDQWWAIVDIAAKQLKK